MEFLLDPKQTEVDTAKGVGKSELTPGKKASV
jgi:hypothetical protein